MNNGHNYNKLHEKEKNKQISERVLSIEPIIVY